MVRPAKTEKPMTIERVERALDKLAQIVDRRIVDGHKIMPIYERLERELADMKAREYKMEEIRARAARSKLRKNKDHPR